MTAERDAAEAVHRRIHRTVDWKSTLRVDLGVIRSLKDPMKVELFNDHNKLEHGADFHLSQFVRWWDHQYALRVGDALLMARIPDGTWIAFDVRSGRDHHAGIHSSRPPAAVGEDVRPAEASTEVGLLSGSVNWNHHIVRKLEVYDAAGTRLGWIPVFGSLP